MKNLTEFINETLYDVALLEDIQSVWKKTKETVQIQDTIKNFCVSMKGQKFSLDNKSELRKVFKIFISKFGFGTDTQNRTILSKYGLATENGFRKFILGNHDELEKNKCYIDWVKQWDETEIEKEYKKAKENGEIPDLVNDDDAEDRDLVIYDRWDPHTHAVYSFVGKRGKSTDHQVNMIRMDFKYEYGVKYYDCYPILAKNYYGHEDELKKRAELQLGYDDPNEFK